PHAPGRVYPQTRPADQDHAHCRRAGQRLVIPTLTLLKASTCNTVCERRKNFLGRRSQLCGPQQPQSHEKRRPGAVVPQ
ncbi:unnamed protein product, partial [Adineta ricciae]